MDTARFQNMDKVYKDELAKSDIDMVELAHYLHDGPEAYERIKRVMELYALDPEIKFNHSYHNMDRKEQMGEMVRKIARLKAITHENKMPPVSYVDYDDYGPPMNSLMTTSLHHGMFETVLRILGSDEQVKEYLPKLLSYEYLGCYSQTELGHGSDVQSLQTEAVFDKETDSFIVNTPCVEATKFWPGELGKLSNHCVFHAKMIIDGQSYGVNAFICRIRDQETHAVLKGLEIGDIGPKYGYTNKDNGYMIFTNFKIPRTALLSRFVSLGPDGQLNIQGDPKVAYSTMLFARISLINYTWKLNVSMCLIAIRYTLQRKQFKTLPNSDQERSVFDYQATQHQLIPFLAYSFACIFSSKQCVAKYNQMLEEIKDDNFKTMKDLHTIVAAFKGLHMQESLDGFFQCREVCGAHGYLHYSNMPNIIEQWSPNVTLEGDTMVMYQQTAKGFIKNFRLVEEYDKKMDGIYSYLNDYKQYVGQKCEITDFKSKDALLGLLKGATTLSIYQASKLLPDIDDEINYDVKWNKEYQLELISAAQLNAINITATMFNDELETRDLSKTLKSVLFKCLELYVSDMLVQHGEILILSGYLTAEQMMDVKSYVPDLIEQIRPDALMLTESFLYLDMLLHSKLSLTHGKIYEELYQVASGAKLNQKDVLDGIPEFVMPLRNRLRGTAKL